MKTMGKKLRGKLITLKEDVHIERRGRTEWESKSLRRGKTTWTGTRPKPAAHLNPLDGILVFNDPNMARAIRERAIPAGYQRPPEITDALEACLYAGGTVVALFDLGLGQRGVYPFPALERFYRHPEGTPPVPKGSLLMYAGMLRATERMYVPSAGEYKNIQVFKHTFITPHGHCIIHDFRLIGPI